MDDYDEIDPSQRQIYKFVKTLFHAAQLTAECAIITLVRHLFVHNRLQGLCLASIHVFCYGIEQVI